jgi:hypothetical protein
MNELEVVMRNSLEFCTVVEVFKPREDREERE